MNIQRFVLPATLAAAFHAALLYGMTHDGVSIGAITLPRAIDPPIDRPVDIIELPVIEDAEIPEVVPMPKGASRPENEEIFREVKDSPFVVEPMKENSRRVVETGKIEPLGVPEGVGDVPKSDFRPHIISCTLLDKQPRAKVQMPPEYPANMKKDGLDGTVMVEFDVDVKGRVVSARVRQSTDRAFEEPTLRAVLKWRFEPGLSKGLPVPFRMVIPVNFKLGAV